MNLEEVKIKLLELEESLLNEDIRFNKRYMENLCSESFFEFGRSGRVYDRKTIIEATPHPIKVKLPLRNFKITPISDNTFLVTYLTEEFVGDTLELSNRSSLWTFENKEWKLHFHQGTPTKLRRAV